jgi:hypothetical protein
MVGILSDYEQQRLKVVATDQELDHLRTQRAQKEVDDLLRE